MTLARPPALLCQAVSCTVLIAARIGIFVERCMLLQGGANAAVARPPPPPGGKATHISKPHMLCDCPLCRSLLVFL
jgi:hypothetical protein